MSRTSFICRADNSDATHFCLCESESLFLCETCLLKHEGKSGHEVYPVTCFRLFLTLGKDKTELKRRVDVSSKCLNFLDRLIARSEAVKEESQTLMRNLTDRYMQWTDQQHLNLLTVVSSVRGEIEMLLTSFQLRLSPFPEILVMQFNELNETRTDNFVTVPEATAIQEVLQSCEKALSRAPRLWQLQLESDFVQQLNESYASSEAEVGMANTDAAWASEPRGPDIAFSNNNKSVTRTDSKNWGCGVWNQAYSHGKVKITFHIDNDGGSDYLYIGVYR